MEIFPAIDLQNGKCVRLVQGDFGSTTIYAENPLEQAGLFQQAGARWLHVIDLDGAQRGEPQQNAVIEILAKDSGLRLQVGGGIRTTEHIARLFAQGVHRIVVGSLAVTDPMRVKRWLRNFGPDKITLALDVRLHKGKAEIMTKGWQEASGQDLFQLLDAYQSAGLKNVLCTDISRDGMMTGANTKLYEMLTGRFSQLDVLASGGVGSLSDIAAIRQTGVAGAIIGKALYEKKFTLSQALKEAENAG